MNRRSFLRGLFATPAAVAAAPMLPDVLRPSFFAKVVTGAQIVRSHADQWVRTIVAGERLWLGDFIEIRDDGRAYRANGNSALVGLYVAENTACFFGIAAVHAAVAEGDR